LAFPVEGGESAFDAGVVLKTAFGGSDGRIATVLSHFDFVFAHSGSGGKGEFEGSGGTGVSTQFNVHVLTGILTTNGGNLESGGRSNGNGKGIFTNVF